MRPDVGDVVAASTLGHRISVRGVGPLLHFRVGL